MTATIEDIRTMLAADGYDLEVERLGDGARVVVTAGEGICSDCLVPKNVMSGILAPVLGVDRDGIDLVYPVDAEH